MQVIAVILSKYDATARGNHRWLVALRDFIDHLRLDIAKRLLALMLEVNADRAANTLLDQVIGVNEQQVQLPSHLPANGGFTGAG
jgi:hypothetical protein